MSVKTLESYQEFTADGSTTYFTFNFNYVDSSEIVVGMRTGDNQYTVVDPVNYVLTKNASTDGGKIRFVTTKPCEDPDDPTCGDYIDNPPPAGTIVRIERKTVRSSTADWYVGLDMNSLVGLFDKLIRITQENTDKFKNTIQTFPTQQGITVRELLSEHDKKIFYWNNEKQWLDITDFTIDDIARQTDVGNILEQANAYSDEQNAVLESRINGKFTAVNSQIDANADAIQKTREDFINADSEIHQILNNHADELTTLRGNQASLGDQVSGIEEKIPGDASATNQLATKADLKDIDLDGYVKKSGDTMTGDLGIVSDTYKTSANISVEGARGRTTIRVSDSEEPGVYSQFELNRSGTFVARTISGTSINYGTVGAPDVPMYNVYTKRLNNGADLIIPTEGGTLARIEDLINLRADINEVDSELQTQITAQAAEIATKQDQLTAGDNIIISNNVISATGAGGGAGFDIVVVQELPATGQKGIIYLLAKDGTAPDVYDEYVWIDATQTFELIGTTQVDLTDYVKNTDYAAESKIGVVRTMGYYGMQVASNGTLLAARKTKAEYDSAPPQMVVGKETLENIKDDYVKRGITTNTITLTDDEKTAARTWLGAVGNTDYAGLNKVGIVGCSDEAATMANVYGYLQAATKYLATYKTAHNFMFIGKGTLENIKNDLVKRAVTENDITLTDEEKAAAQAWLGVESGGGDYLPLSGGALTGAIEFEWSGQYLATKNVVLKTKYYRTDTDTIESRNVLTLMPNGDAQFAQAIQSDFITPISSGLTGQATLGNKFLFWNGVYTTKLNAGRQNNVDSGDLIVPTEGGTLARLEDLEGIGGASLPDQTGNAGKFLTTDGTNASWTEMPGLIIRRL